MSRKGYQEAHLSNYSRPPCSQEIQNTQQYISYTMPLVPNNVYSVQGQNMFDVMYSHQNHRRNQLPYSQTSSNIYSDHDHHNQNWINESRTNDTEKSVKSDKLEAVEITSKDLSPASFCSNVDILLPDFYKSVNKDSHYNKMQESQWFYNTNYNHKYNEYPSCAQFNCDENITDKTVKYCSIQKQGGVDKSSTNMNNCLFNSDLTNSQMIHQFVNTSSKFYVQENQCDYSMYNQLDKVQDINMLNSNMQHDEYYPQNQILCSEGLHFPTIQNIDQHTEGSNDESDIIVEESEEEVTDYSEDLEKRLNYSTNCIICNVLYTSTGNQFYILTNSSPLTMSSQQPVYRKLTEIVGVISGKCNYICSHCLGLINTIDHLQYKLDSCKCELFNKFSITNGKNTKESTSEKPFTSRLYKQKFRNRCNHSFICKFCKKIFSLRKYYIFHMSRHKYKNRYLCEICGKRFDKVSKFMLHLKFHKKSASHKKTIKISAFSCVICKKPFRTNSNLKEHKNYCSGSLPYACKVSTCDKKFATPTKLKHHIKLKHDKKFASICSICNIGFVKMSDYKAHMVSHSADKKYNCSKCDKSYKTLSNLNFHLKFHNEKLPFLCDICNKGFMRKEYLESHLNLHNGIKSFACHSCDKKFVSQKNLDAHLKYHDGNIKKKSCNICGKSISTSLEDHIRTHSNLREFNCSSCGMKFNTRNALAKHTKRKHNCEVMDN